MKRISPGGRIAVLVLACFGLLGVALTVSDYARHGDLTNLAWVTICVVLIALILVFDRTKTLNDKAGPGAALLVLALASGLLSCQSVPTATRPATAAEIATAEQLFPAPSMRTDSAGWTGPKLVTAR
jgi:cell division protein FtsW (lipid II flippase)